MITQQYEFGSDVISDILNTLADEIGSAIISIITEFFAVFFNYLISLVEGSGLGSNPGVYLIGLMIIFTAFMIYMRS